MGGHVSFANSSTCPLRLTSTRRPFSDARRDIIEALERLTISEALRIAQQQAAEAQQAKDSGDPEGEQRVQQWSDTLYALEF